MRQWSMRIKAYAERLLSGLEGIDWTDSIKDQQRNWIGKSVGCSLQFGIRNSTLQIEVFTTRPDTIFGVSFMVLAPEHPLVDEITTAEFADAVGKYKKDASVKSERDRQADVKNITGQFTGAFAIHPFNGEKIQIWGGDAMIDWAERKLKQIDRQNFSIQNEEERIISGPLMLADTPIYRNDDNGEYYVVFTKETIKKIAQRFFKKGYQSNVNLMHDQGNLTEGMTMFESWIKDDKRGIKAMKGFEDVPDGSWFGSFKVDNDEVWKLVKEGKVRGFSVEGQFNYRKTGDKRIEQLWENVLGVLAQIG
jgi:leucyl-tRNA synthetase